MAFLNIAALLPVWLAAAGLHVQWVDAAHDSVQVRYQGDRTEFVKSCVQGGFKVRYRFQIQICKRRPAWFDTCRDTRRIDRSMQYDAIRDGYKIVSDQLGDDEQPIARAAPHFGEALQQLSMIPDVALHYLAHGSEEFINSRRSYLSVRVVGDCRGDYNKTLARVSSFLTLGLVRIGSFDSGWTDFTLQSGSPE